MKGNWKHIMRIRRALVPVAAAATAAFTLGAPAAGASPLAPSAFPVASGFVPFQGVPPFGGASASAGNISSLTGPCGTTAAQHAQGATAGTATQVCSGSGLTFIGPQIGQIASVVGPTIIGPAVIGNVVVSAGNGNAG